MAKRKMPLKVAQEYLAGCTAHTCLFAQGTLIWKKENRTVASGVFLGHRKLVCIKETKQYGPTFYRGRRALFLKDLGALQPEVLEGVTWRGRVLVDPNPKRP